MTEREPTLRERLRHLVDDNTAGPGRAFEAVVQLLIVISLVSFSVETLPGLSALALRTLQWIETTTVLLFSCEYLLRLTAAERRLRFVFSFYGLIDLIAIAPFYLRLTADLRAVRIFRMLRLLRALKLLRYSRALQRFRRALALIREDLVLFFAATAFVLFVAAAGIYSFEHEAQPKVFASVFHSLWWAVTTLTTVGYGDAAPITAGGKVFTFFVLMVGLGIVAVPTGLLASALTWTAKDEASDEE